MMRFKTEAEAIEYAQENIGKYDYEIAEVDGKQAFLSSTGLPIEEFLRNRIEPMVEEFLKEFDIKDLDDTVAFLGAELEGMVIDKIERETGIRILSARMCY